MKPKTKTSSNIAFKNLVGGEVSSLTGKSFGTFKGVYVPTILNLLGLMMYLRQGWVVGNAGLLGALSIVVFCCAITGITALCISSIITNIRIGSGGVFSLVSQSLGLQVGGSIGIPLYLVQALSAVLYMFGFLEAWEFIFPDHPRILVIFSLAGVLFFVAFVGVNFAFRIQIFIMVLVGCALMSIFSGVFRFNTVPVREIELWGSFQDASYWELFAIYFPAVTGIKVGASMSGNLIKPRKSIPRGTLLAWGTSSFIYIALCFWYAFMGTSETLRNNFLFSVENAYIGNLVLLGILCSCFTAALSSIVAAPRVLQALSSYNIFPFSNYFKVLYRGEPFYAFLGTAALIFIILLAFEDINAIAPIITQFFIVIYFIINIVLVIEQRLNLVSFRPEWRLPIALPVLGSILSLVAMIIISPILGLISLFSVALLYFYLSRKQLETPWETVQSGLLVAISEWFMKWAAKSGSRENRRIWKPDFLILLSDASELKHWYRLLRTMLFPQGSLHIILLSSISEATRLSKNKLSKTKKPLLQEAKKSLPSHTSPTLVKRTLKHFHEQGIYASASHMETKTYLSGVDSVVTLTKNFFPSPNSIFVSIREHQTSELNRIIEITRRERKAVVFFTSPLLSTTGREQEVVIWVRDQTPNWHLSLSMSNLDYAILLGYQIKKNWKGSLRLVCVVQEENHSEVATEYLQQLSELARLGGNVNIHVLSGSFEQALKKFVSADLHIIGVGDQVDKSGLIRLSQLAKSPCLFVKDSGAGIESALV